MRPLLESRFTVIACDRRGRGDSADGDGYSLDREFEDLEAVLAMAGEDAFLLGHSYGGLISAATVPRLASVSRLVLYEPPAGGVLAEPERIDLWEELIEAGDVERFLRDYMQEVGGYTPAQIDAFRATPAWARRVEVAPTVPREMRAEHAFHADQEALGAFASPTLLLLGSESPSWAVRSTSVYADALPNATVRPLEGHGHAATVTAPELLAREVTSFLLD